VHIRHLWWCRVKSDYEIVNATLSHVAAIPAIEQAAAAIFAEVDLPLQVRYLVTDKEMLIEAQQEGRIWIALGKNSMPVGFAMVTVVDGNAHLDEVDVLPAHSRKGIGTRLVEKVVGWARSNGYMALTLVTFRHVSWNAPFYLRLGFEPVQRDTIGAELKVLLAAEASGGIDIENRLVMKLRTR